MLDHAQVEPVYALRDTFLQHENYFMYLFSLVSQLSNP